jgi:hypothetical protein
MKARMREILKRPAQTAGLLLLACLFASTAFAQIDSGVAHCNQQQFQSGQGGGGGCPQLLKQNKQPGQPVPQSLPVTVQNTPNVNVVNTPSVSVTNTPSVSVTNTPSVTLEAGASVAVTNLPDSQGNPTPVATLEAVQPYASECDIFFSGSFEGGCNFTALPEGKQLVVQEFDAEGFIPAGNRPTDVELVYTMAGANFFPSTFMVSVGGFDFLASHQETRLYVAQGMTPQCYVELAQNSSVGGYICNISGFLVDVPSGQQPITVQHAKSLSQMLRKLQDR